MGEPVVFLLDNGSLEPAATLRLRELAAALGRATGHAVEPVSLLHSSAVPAEALGGVAAEIFEPAVRRRAEAGRTAIVVVPLFFGPSRALTEYLPERVATVRRALPGVAVRLAAPLFAEEDERLACILADHVRATAARMSRPAAGPVPVALVDHGSPLRAVTEVRNALARQLGSLLGDGFDVRPCSMERREGAEFDFCEPLLSRLLTQADWARGDVVIAMQFLQPGRHAGAGGDVARICRDAEAARAGLRTRLTPLIGEHPRLIEILADRLGGPLRSL